MSPMPQIAKLRTRMPNSTLATQPVACLRRESSMRWVPSWLASRVPGRGPRRGPRPYGLHRRSATPAQAPHGRSAAGPRWKGPACVIPPARLHGISGCIDGAARGRSCSATGRCTACAPRRGRSPAPWRSIAGARTGTLGDLPAVHRAGRGRRRGSTARASWSAARTATPRPRVPSPARSARRCSRTPAPPPCIVGHSERRHGLGETDAMVRAKAAAGAARRASSSSCASARPRREREAGRTVEVLDAPARGQLARGCHGRQHRRRLRAGLGDRHRPHRHRGRHRAEPRRDRRASSRQLGAGGRRRSSTAARSRPTTPARSWPCPGSPACSSAARPWMRPASGPSTRRAAALEPGLRPYHARHGLDTELSLPP